MRHGEVPDAHARCNARQKSGTADVTRPQPQLKHGAGGKQTLHMSYLRQTNFDLRQGFFC